MRRRAELELKYQRQASQDEANNRSRLVNEGELIAVAVEQQKKYQAEIARLNGLLRANGIADEISAQPSGQQSVLDVDGHSLWPRIRQV